MEIFRHFYVDEVGGTYFYYSVHKYFYKTIFQQIGKQQFDCIQVLKNFGKFRKQFFV